MMNEIPEREPLPEKTSSISLNRLAIILTLVFVALLVMLLCSRGLDWAASILWPNPTPVKVELTNQDHPSVSAPTPSPMAHINPVPMSPVTGSSVNAQNPVVPTSNGNTPLLPQETTPSVISHPPLTEHQPTQAGNQPVESLVTPPPTVEGTDPSSEEVQVLSPETEKQKHGISGSHSTPPIQGTHSQLKSNEPPPNPKKGNITLTKSEQEILQVKPHHYAIQILAMHDKKKLLAFINSSQLNGKARYYCGTFQGKPWYVLIYGDYKTIEDAHKAILTLPEDIKKQKPWVRSYALLQDAINAR
jgi:DamX protein